jgi:predicted phosphate transport protein (TIGR00153 family)
MKLDLLIRKVLPRDERFFVVFEETTQNLLKAVVLLKDLATVRNAKKRDALVEAIKELEHVGDDLTHKMFSELNATFVTPLDREDIHVLGSSIDDILDHIDGTASRFTIYNIKSVPPGVGKLVDVLERSIKELHQGVVLLRDVHRTEALQAVIQKINEQENEADAIFDEAIGRLFAREKKPIELIKIKEILVGLETATDKCEDAANVLEAILIKHA